VQLMASVWGNILDRPIQAGESAEPDEPAPSDPPLLRAAVGIAGGWDDLVALMREDATFACAEPGCRTLIGVTFACLGHRIQPGGARPGSLADRPSSARTLAARSSWVNGLARNGAPGSSSPPWNTSEANPDM